MSNLFSQVFLWVYITFVIKIIKVSYKYCLYHSTAWCPLSYPEESSLFSFGPIHLPSFIYHSLIHTIFQPHWTSHHSFHTTGTCICYSLNLECFLLSSILTYSSRFTSNAFQAPECTVDRFRLYSSFFISVTAFITW